MSVNANPQVLNPHPKPNVAIPVPPNTADLAPQNVTNQDPPDVFVVTAITNTIVAPLVLQNHGVGLALAVHTNTYLGKPTGVATTRHFQRSPSVEGMLDFRNKLHKVFYDQGCKRFYKGYDVDAERSHTFIMILNLRIK